MAEGPQYCLLADLKKWVGITDDSNDAALTLIIEGVSGLFDLIYGETFESREVTEFHNGAHSEKGIILNSIPDPDLTNWTSDAKVFESDVELTIDTEYRVEDPPTRKLIRMEDATTVRLTGFVPGDRNIRVVFKTRFVIIPHDIELACIEESVRRWQASNAGGAADGGRIGITSRTPDTGTSLTYTVDDLTETTLRMLERYRRQRAF